MKLILILLSVFFTLFNISESNFSITYGDFFSFFILVFFAHDLAKGNLKFNFYSKIWFYFIVLMLFSSIINMTLTEGRFLNVFKTNIFSFVYFVYVFSILNKKANQYKIVIFGLITLAFFFILKTWSEMQSAWLSSSNNFTNVDIFKSSLNLNTWGFVLVLFFIFSMYCWTLKLYSKVFMLFSILILVFIFFSYSRAAYSLIALVLVWVFFYVNKFNAKIFFATFIVIATLFSFKDFLNIFNFQISDTALEFFEKKSSTYTDDLVDTRFYLINIKPLDDIYSNFNFFELLFGDALSVQHSFFSHNLIVFGIVGLILYLKRFVDVIKYCTIKIKSRINVIPSKFILLIVIVNLINDFITNVSNFLPFASYLSTIIIALFFADLEARKKSSDLSHK